MREFNSFGAFASFLRQTAADMERGKRVALDAGATTLLNHVREIPGNYQSGWPALKPATIARKATGDSPELETGAMRQSYERHVGRDDMDVGSNSDIALYQEMGTSRIPPRPVLGAAVAQHGPDVAQKIAGKYVAPLVGGAQPSGKVQRES